jgi:hypothetical protein
MATWRREIEEYEADLYRVQEPTLLSKLLSLFSRAKSGEMEIELYGLKIPPGSAVSVVVDGSAICEVRTQGGYARLFLSTTRGETVPELQSGSVAEIHHMGAVLLQGTFKPD